jgi:hypothetical protein
MMREDAVGVPRRHPRPSAGVRLLGEYPRVRRPLKTVRNGPKFTGRLKRQCAKMDDLDGKDC